MFKAFHIHSYFQSPSGRTVPYRLPFDNALCTIETLLHHLQQNWIKFHASKISSRETSMRQCPLCGCSACNSWRSIFIFWTRSRLYFGNGESLSARHESSPLCWFWHVGGASVVDGGGISDNGGGDGWRMTLPALLTTAAWLVSRLQIHKRTKWLRNSNSAPTLWTWLLLSK